MAEYSSRTDRGYKIVLEVNQVDNTRVKARLILVNTTAHFMLYTVSAQLTVRGQTFSYSGQVNIPRLHMRTVLIERTVTVPTNAVNIGVSATATLPTGAHYLPVSPRFEVANQVYALPTRNKLTANANKGASLTFTLPADSSGDVGALNEYLWWRQVFWCGDFNQCGVIKISFTGDNDEFLYGTETIKRKAGSEVEYNFLVSNGSGGYEIKKRWTFKPTSQVKDNPFRPETGWSDIRRRDDEVQVFWWGSYPKFTVPTIKGKKTKKIHIALCLIGTNPKVTHMYVDGLTYRKDFVETWEDVPNRFGKGSVVVIDSEKDRVTVDNLDKNKDVVQGSDFITLPPGDSVLEVYRSHWAKSPPEITVAFEERYL